MRALPIIFTMVLQGFLLAAAAQSPYFTLDPCLTPDAQNIIFSQGGDLWQVPTNGGRAFRITAMDGEETRPNVSPDGQWLAFTATRNGNKDVFIMPMEGGAITQLTYHSAFDDVDSWSWDSKTIYFTSNRYNQFAGYTISIEGGSPKRLFDHYFNTVHNLSEHPTSGEIFFNESWESKIFAHRKRYKGDYNPDIKSYDPSTGEYREYTDYRGKDFGATIDRDGTIYYMSDQGKDVYNLFRIQGNDKQQLTDFDIALFWPKVSANGEKVVFRKGYQIFVFDVASGVTTQPEIRLSDDNILTKEQSFKLKGKISDLAISPDNKKMAFISRGVLFLSDIKGKFIRQLQTGSAEAVGEVHWLSDNNTLIFSRTHDGYYNWCTMKVDSVAEPERITIDLQNQRLLTFNSDWSKAVYLSGRNEVRVMDLETFESETIASDELWALYNPTPYFSPDDQYIIYAAKRDFEDDLFIYNLDAKTSQNLTNTRVSETSPYWSPDGKYIYLACDRLQPSYPYGTDQSKIYRIALDQYDEPFRDAELSKLLKKDTTDNEEKDDSEKDEEQRSHFQRHGRCSEKQASLAVMLDIFIT